MRSMFYNDITTIDCSIFDPQQGPVGVSYAVSLELQGELDADGVIVDFALAKKKAKEIIDQQIDHRFVVFDHQGTITKEGSREESLRFKGSYQNPHHPAPFSVEYLAPTGAFLVLSSAAAGGKADFKAALSRYGAQALAAALAAQAKNVVIDLILQEEGEDEDEVDSDDLDTEDNADEVDEEELEDDVEEDDGDESYVFHYTHGLQKHHGHCQRMLHGHTGTLEFSDLEPEGSGRVKQFLQQKLPAVVHFSAWNEVVNQQEILAQYPTIAQQGGTCPGIKVQMAYRGTEGDFALTLPGEQVYLLPMVPTIENLAAYWFKQMAEQSATLWLVQAYEGIGKGATIER